MSFSSLKRKRWKEHTCNHRSCYHLVNAWSLCRSQSDHIIKVRKNCFFGQTPFAFFRQYISWTFTRSVTESMLNANTNEETKFFAHDFFYLFIIISGPFPKTLRKSDDYNFNFLKKMLYLNGQCNLKLT